MANKLLLYIFTESFSRQGFIQDFELGGGDRMVAG